VPESNVRDSKILIVEDQRTIVMVLEALLQQAGYSNVASTTDPRETCNLCAELDPDIVLLDLHMPHMDGYAVMSRLREEVDTTFLPILVLTAEIAPEFKRKALSLGATDFLTKPFDATEVILRIDNLLRTRALHLELESRNASAEQKASDQRADLSAAISRLETTQEELRLCREEVQRLLATSDGADGGPSGAESTPTPGCH
jgi:PleD family two-component response regulator